MNIFWFIVLLIGLVAKIFYDIIFIFLNNKKER